MNTSRILGIGLTVAAFTSLAAADPSRAASSVTHDYNYSVNAPTPASFLGTGDGHIVFRFDPVGPNPAPATVTGSNLTFSSGWSLDYFGSSTSGIASFNPFGPSVTLGNGTAHNYASVAVTNWGDSFGFDLNYADPPGTDPTAFSLTYQKTGQADVSLLDISFDPSGRPR